MALRDMISGATDSFIELILAGVIISVIGGLSLVNSSTFVSSLMTKVEDGMTQLTGIVILVVVVSALVIVQRRR